MKYKIGDRFVYTDDNQTAYKCIITNINGWSYTVIWDDYYANERFTNKLSKSMIDRSLVHIPIIQLPEDLFIL